MRKPILHAVLVWLLGAGAALFILWPAPKALAANPTTINFQGRVTNPDGTNVTDGSYSFVFRLYDQSSPTTSGTCASNSHCWWEETDTLTVASGVFQVQLGAACAFTSACNSGHSGINWNTNNALYLTLQFNSDSAGFMSPTIPLSSVPYAFNADSLGGLAAANYVQLAQGVQTDASTTNPSIFINKTGTAANILTLQSSGSTVLAVNNSGNLQLTAPAPPTTDILSISNAGQAAITAGADGLEINYVGGAAAVAAEGERIDLTPGTTSGGTWDGLHIVADATGAASGVNEYGLQIDGPTSPGNGTEEGAYIGTGWDIGLDIQSGGLQLAAQSDPSVPAANNLRIYAKNIAGRTLPMWESPTGLVTPFQASLGFNRVAFSEPNGTANCSTGAQGLGSTSTGNNTAGCSAPSPSSTNLKDSTRLLQFKTTTTAGTVNYQKQSVMQVWRGNAAGMGGFFYTIRFGVNTMVSGNYIFVGLADYSSAPGNNDPLTTTTVDRLGVAVDTNSGNWKWANNITGTTPTVTDLGSSLAINTTDLYELIIFCPENGSTINYRVTDLSTGGQATGSASTNIPAATTFLAPLFYISNNAQAANAIFDFGGWYLESDN